MSRTQSLIHDRLPRDLTLIVINYFSSVRPSHSEYIAAARGEYERCMTLLDVNSILYGACEEGFQLLVELAIDRGANSWYVGFASACIYKHRRIMRMMFDRGARGICRWCYKDIASHKLN